MDKILDIDTTLLLLGLADRRGTADRHGMPWSAAESSMILAMRRQRGMNVPEIAEAIGRRTEAVYGHFAVLGDRAFVRRTWDRTDAETAIARAESGESYDAIAADYGRSVEQLRSMFETRGYRPNRRRTWTADQIAAFDAMVAAGERDAATIALSLGRASGGVRDRLRSLGLVGRAAARARRAEAEARLAAARADTAGLATAATVPARSPCLWDEAVVARLKTLVDERGVGGNAVAAIAAELGTTPRMVRQKGIALGLIRRKRARRGLDPAGIEKARALAATTSITGVAKAIGCDIRTLKAWADAHGLTFAAAGRSAGRPVASTVRRATATAAEETRKRPRAKTADVHAATNRGTETTKPFVGEDRRGRKAAADLAAIARTQIAARQAAEPPVAATVGTAAPTTATRPPIVAATASPTSPGAAWKAARTAVEGSGPASTPVRIGRDDATARTGARAAKIVLVDRAEEPTGRRRYAGFVRRTKGPTVDAATLRDQTADAIARHLATRGVTKLRLDPLAELEAAVRRRGYGLVRQGAGYLVDGRIALADEASLRTFAEARGIAARSAA